jgi:Uma2 family endonuclease
MIDRRLSIAKVRREPLHSTGDDVIVFSSRRGLVAGQTMKTRTLITADDYFALPDDGKQYELLAGELYVNPTPSFPHQDVAKRLFRQLDEFFEGKGLGEVFFAPLGVVLGQHDVAEPDLMVVADPSQFSQRGIEGPPLLVVEILSQSNARHDRVTKAARYLALGVKHYWIVDPRKRHLLCQRVENGRWVVVAEGLDDSRVSDPSWSGLIVDLQRLWRPRT